VEYPALFERDPKGGILVTFPDFGFATHGDNETDAYGMAQDLLIHMLFDRIAGKQDIPRPGKLRSKQGRVRLVAVAALVAAKVALYEELRASHMTKAELARRMGQPKQQVERLFDLRRASRMDQIERAFAALGKRLAIEVQNAA
jgi:antitoxin HicB